MKFIDNITADMHSSMKSGDKVKTKVLRVLLAKLKEYQINHRKELTEKECISVIKTSVKQGNEAADIYEKANRLDLAEKEQNELNIIEQFLPKQKTQEEIKRIVKDVIESMNVTGMQDMGLVMKKVMDITRGSADGKLISEEVRSILK